MIAVIEGGGTFSDWIENPRALMTALELLEQRAREYERARRR